jgi:hypothetical protein
VGSRRQCRLVQAPGVLPVSSRTVGLEGVAGDPGGHDRDVVATVHGIGVRDSVTVHPLANPAALCVNHWVFFVAASGQIRLAANRPVRRRFAPLRLVSPALLGRESGQQAEGGLGWGARLGAVEDDALAGVLDQLQDLFVEAEAADQRMPEIADAGAALADDVAGPELGEFGAVDAEVADQRSQARVVGVPSAG